MNNVLLPPASGEGEAARGPALVHAVSRWAHLLPVHPVDHHRHLPDVLLHAHRHPGLRRCPGALHQRRLRLAGEEHAPLGGAPDGAHRLPPHEPGVLSRRLQAAARVQLDRRRRAPALDSAAVVHRVPPPLGPAGALGGDRGDQHGRVRSRVRSTGEVRPARRCRRSRPTPCSGGTCSTSSSSPSSS